MITSSVNLKRTRTFLTPLRINTLRVLEEVNVSRFFIITQIGNRVEEQNHPHEFRHLSQKNVLTHQVQEKIVRVLVTFRSFRFNLLVFCFQHWLGPKLGSVRDYEIKLAMGKSCNLIGVNVSVFRKFFRVSREKIRNEVRK